MDSFIDALLSQKTDKIPDEYVLDDENSYWIFSDITDNSFVWRNVMISANGTSTLDCEIHGKRMN